MTIYSDSVIIIEFTPKTEVLCIRWRSIRQKQMFELEQSIHVLVCKIKELKVTKLLLYSVKNVAVIPFEKFESFMLLLISSLAESGLEKVARIMFDDSEIEKITENSDEINEGMGIRYEYRTFPNRQTALAWLNQ